MESRVAGFRHACAAKHDDGAGASGHVERSTIAEERGNGICMIFQFGDAVTVRQIDRRGCQAGRQPAITRQVMEMIFPNHRFAASRRIVRPEAGVDPHSQKKP